MRAHRGAMLSDMAMKLVNMLVPMLTQFLMNKWVVMREKTAG